MFLRNCWYAAGFSDDFGHALTARTFLGEAVVIYHEPKAHTDGDVLVFAHGHILRVLTARWLRMEVANGARFALATASLGVLGWERETEVIARWNAGAA